MGTAPNGVEMMRPYRKVKRTCAATCVCTPAYEEDYESCALTATSYKYTDRACEPVYKVASTDDATFLDSGITYHFTPLDTDSFDEPQVLIGASYFNSFCSAAGETTCSTLSTAGLAYTNAGISYLEAAPIIQNFASSPTSKQFSLSMHGTKFVFYGVDYDTVTVFDDGYLCFGDVGSPSFKDVSDTIDAHFGGGYPCFSFLQTGLGASGGSNVGYQYRKCYKDKKIGSGSWESDSTTFTFEQVPLEGSTYLDTPASATVQVALIFPSDIRVSFKDVPTITTAVIGPSRGTGVPEGYVTPPLPRN